MLIADGDIVQHISGKIGIAIVDVSTDYISGEQEIPTIPVLIRHQYTGWPYPTYLLITWPMNEVKVIDSTYRIEACPGDSVFCKKTGKICRIIHIHNVYAHIDPYMPERFIMPCIEYVLDNGETILKQDAIILKWPEPEQKNPPPKINRLKKIFNSCVLNKI